MKIFPPIILLRNLLNKWTISEMQKMRRFGWLGYKIYLAQLRRCAALLTNALACELPSNAMQTTWAFPPTVPNSKLEWWIHPAVCVGTGCSDSARSSRMLQSSWKVHQKFHEDCLSPCNGCAWLGNIWWAGARSGSSLASLATVPIILKMSAFSSTEVTEAHSIYPMDWVFVDWTELTWYGERS